MSHRLLGFFFTLALLLTAGTGIHEQELDFSRLQHGGNFESVEQRLQKHNVSLTKPALLRALHGEDFELRWLAAQELIQLYKNEAIPDVLSALKAEKDPVAREIIAAILARIDEIHGFEALRSMCYDPNLTGYQRLAAADDLLTLQDQTCLNAVAEVIQSQAHEPRSTSAMLYGLSMVPRFQKLSPDDSSRLAIAAAEALKHPDLLVRTAAGRALAGLGDGSAIPYLEKAAVAESNQSAASELQGSLLRLRQKSSRN